MYPSTYPSTGARIQTGVRRRPVRLSVLAAVTLASVLAACGGGDAEPAAEAAVPTPASATGSATEVGRPAFGLVDTAQAAALAVDPEVVVLDVRTPEEFAEGHLARAEMIDFNDPSFADRVAALDRDADYLVYCRSGNRSAQAVAVMRSQGFQRLWDMEGGIITWSAEGRELVG